MIHGPEKNWRVVRGVTSILSARQLNDLAAFEAAPHGPVGEAVAVRGTALVVKKLRAKFGKSAGKDALTLVATAAVASGQVWDPASGEVAVTIGVPSGPGMAVVGWTFPAGTVTGRNGRYRAKGGANGLRRLALKVKNGKLTMQLAARTDLAALRSTLEWTIGVEVGLDTASITRPLKANKKGNRVKGP